MFRPGIIIAQCNLPGILLWTLAMAEPVAHHELNPGRRQHVDRCRRLKLLTSQQFKAHSTRAGSEDGRLRFGKGVLDGYVAAKARTSHTHSRVVQIVMSAVRSTRCQITGLHRFNSRLIDSRLVCCIIQICLPQDVAQPDQDEQSQRSRYFIPSVGMIQCLCKLVIDKPERRLAIAGLSGISRLHSANLFAGNTLAYNPGCYTCYECSKCQKYPRYTFG